MGTPNYVTEVKQGQLGTVNHDSSGSFSLAKMNLLKNNPTNLRKYYQDIAI